MSKLRRVVITGIGPITAIGTGVEGLWKGITEGRHGVRRLSRLNPSLYRCQVAAEVRDFRPEDYFEGREVKRLNRFTQFALAAVDMALADASLRAADVDPERAGVCLGSAMGGMCTAEEQHEVYQSQGARSINPTLAVSVCVATGSCNAAIRTGWRGPNTSNGDSCAAGAIAIGNSFRFIQRGDADVMLAGGVEAPLAELTFAAFDIIRAMSRRDDNPEQACCPFSARRDGFVMGEGAGVLLLEELEHAQRRGVRVYAELCGFGITNDAHHMAAPRTDGSAASRCIRLALQDADLAPEDVELISAHGTSTPLNDPQETQVIRTVFGDYAPRVPISGTKSMHGHPLGASGAIELAIGALAIQRGFVPPTLHLHDPDPECDLDYVPHQGRWQPVRTVLSNSFGFGGINACLALRAA
jgi:3-oxoacyl-[acyl-carrier-protein] synthase II